MKILVTGARGMVGMALVNNLKNIRDGKNRTRPALIVDEVFEYDVDSDIEELNIYCREADFVFNLAGVNRPQNPEDFMKGNYGFASVLLDTLEKYGNRCPVMLSSSIQATLAGRFAGSEYGKSKKEGENLFFSYAERTGTLVYVFRFPNIMGHSKPGYNSVISTLCHAFACNLEYTINDRNTELEVLYIDDLIEGMFDLLEGKTEKCEFDGVEAVSNPNGRFCYIPVTHRVTLGEIADMLEEFRHYSSELYMPEMKDGSFRKKLFSLYLSYLMPENFKFSYKTVSDVRGSFTELVHYPDFGQVSVNTVRPGMTKGQHWHNSKWEQFIVVSGHGRISERNINTGEIVRFEVSGEKPESVFMVPGWTHCIENCSKTEDLVFIIICNENFNPEKPDTFYCPVFEPDKQCTSRLKTE